MKNNKHINTRKITAVLLALLFAIQLVPVFPSAESEGVEEYITLYHWRKINTIDDLADFYTDTSKLSEGRYILRNYPVLLMWGNFKSTLYISTGNDTESKNWIDDQYLDPDADEFYSTSDYNSWSICVQGITNINGYGYYCSFYGHDDYAMVNEGWNMEASTPGWVTCDKSNFNNSETVVFPYTKQYSDKYYGYNKNVSKGKVIICHELKNSTDYDLFPHSNDMLWVRDAGWDYSNWTMFVCDYTTSVNAFGSETYVRSGSTLQIDRTSVLRENCKIYVEPGASLNITGNFYNNGTIINYGTILVSGKLTSLGLESKAIEGGSIINYGSKYKCTSTALKGKSAYGEGNFLVTGTGSVILPYNVTGISDTDYYFVYKGVSTLYCMPCQIISASFKLYGGASCVNNGFMFIPGSICMNSSHFTNAVNGYVISHRYAQSRYSVLAKLPELGEDEFNLCDTHTKDTYTGGRSYVESYGKWTDCSAKSYGFTLDDVRFTSTFG